MEKQYKEQWLEALKSGKYKKGTGKLRAKEDDGSYSWCCIGVYCDVRGFKLEESGMDCVEQDDKLWYKPANLEIGYAHLDKLVEINDRGKNRSENFDDVIKYIEANL